MTAGNRPFVQAMHHTPWQTCCYNRRFLELDIDCFKEYNGQT